MTSTSVIGTKFFGLDVSGLGESLRFFGRRISRSTLLIEFAPRMLQIAEAKPRSHGIEIKHLSRIVLPEGALDRSVPADPSVMAQLLRDLCKEKRIVSHRAAVVLPSELAFQRLIKLPQSLSVEEARSFLLDPNNGVTLPFPLAQTDFDLTPMQLQAASMSHQKTYQLTAVPNTLVDPIISMLELSGFELQQLELGVLSTLRCVKHEVTELSDSEICLILDFSSEATLVTIVGSSGPIDSERLPSTREFPRFELSGIETDQIVERSKSLEDVTIENDQYLPVSEMDLRAFHRDLQNVMERFLQRFPDLRLKKIYLTGDGSAHPDFPDLLQNTMNVPVKVIRPLLSEGIRDWSLDEPLLLVGLSRLVGLGLGLLPSARSVNVSTHADASKNNLHDLNNLLVNTVNSDSNGLIADQLPIQTTELESNSEQLPDARSDIANDVIAVSSVAVVEDDQSEWPSLKLDDLQDTASQEIVEGDGLAEANDTVELRAELIEEEKTQALPLKLQHLENSSLTSDGNEDCGSKLSQVSELIPGLPIQEDTQDQSMVADEAKKKTDSDPITTDESPLGLLKFQDD